MSQNSIRENEFFPAPGGTNGTVNYQTGYGTFSSPDASQTPDHFTQGKKHVGNNSNTRKNADTNPESDINAIYAKKDTPTPDEVVTGIKYELGQQIKKDKALAKQTVLTNLKKDPHYYGKLKMLNIDDESMLQNMSENKSDAADRIVSMKNAGHGKWIGSCGHVIKQCRCPHGSEMEFKTLSLCDACKNKSKSLQESKHPNDAPERAKVTPNIEETKKIFAEMSKGRDNKYVVNSQISDVMKEMWEKKKQRSSWKNK